MYRKLARDEVFDRELSPTWPRMGLSTESDVPIMVIVEASPKKYRVYFRNTERHRASYRCQTIASFVEHVVLTDPAADPARYVGEYRFEPHDTIDDGPRDEPTLCFARDIRRESGAKTKNCVLFPDVYQLCGYRGQFDMYVDDVPWADKAPVVLFAGTTTGPEDPAKNRRVQAALWARGRESSGLILKLSSVRQMTPESLEGYLRTKGATLGDVLCGFVEPSEHKRVRYVLNIEGNTCCWSRLPMVLRSGSLLINLQHGDGTWYYPVLEAGKHYVEAADVADIEARRSWCEAHPKECADIVGNGNRFFDEYCTQAAATRYIVELLEAIADYRCRSKSDSVEVKEETRRQTLRLL